MKKLSKHAQYQLQNFHGNHSDMSFKLIEILEEIDEKLVKDYKLWHVWGNICKMERGLK